MTKYCGQCGTANKDSNLFCSSCGNRLDTNTVQNISPETSYSGYTKEMTWSGRHSLIAMWFWILASVFIIGIPVVLYLYLKDSYQITPDRVVKRSGILGKREISARKNQITDIYVKQGFFARVLGYGDVVINTAGTASYEMIIKSVQNPNKIKELLMRTI